MRGKSETKCTALGIFYSLKDSRSASPIPFSLAFLKSDERYDDLTPHLVGLSNDSGLLHLGETVQRHLDLYGLDVQAAAHDELFASDDGVTSGVYQVCSGWRES